LGFKVDTQKSTSKLSKKDNMKQERRSAGEAWSSLVLATVTGFAGTNSVNKNGDKAVMLQVLGGKFPVNRIVIDGTVAKRMVTDDDQPIKKGHTYLFRCLFKGTDEVFGDDYNWTVVKEANTISEITTGQKDVGAAEPFTAWEPEGKRDAYQRKSVAIESAQTKRIRDGHYVPAVSSVRDHRNAKTIPGTSITTGDPQSLNLTEDDLKKGQALNAHQGEEKK
jgi:hypothetical protein